jgi:heat shock protein HslJ
VRRGLVFLAGIAVLVGIAALISATGDDDREDGSPAGDLEGVVWEWQELLGGDGSRIAPEDPSRYTIEFGDDGRLALLADCNRGSGRYEVDGPSIAIGTIATTRAACPEGSLDRVFVERLEYVRTYLVVDGELFLDLYADAGQLRFRPAA